MIIGIDLGTSNSMAAVYKEGKVDIILSGNGNKIIPTVVSTYEDGTLCVGDVAKERSTKHPKLSASLFKRTMGSNKMYAIGDKELMSQELCAIILKYIKDNASIYLGEEVTQAVISVPAFFNNAQRKAVLQAGTLAGLDVKKIISEPTAAALAYGIKGTTDGLFEEKIILVLDLGGGTFDISVMEASDKIMEVVAVCGDNKLGGSDFTMKLIDIFKEKNNIEEPINEDEWAILWEQAEQAKKTISIKGEGSLSCSINGVNYETVITEAEYEEACFDLLDRIRKLTVKAIEESKYKSSEIEEVIMVGGATKLSMVKRLIEKLAGKNLDYPISPDEAVVMGAAIQGAMLEKNEDVVDLIMTDISPYYLGAQTLGGTRYDNQTVYDVLIPKNVTIPYKGTVEQNMGCDNFVMGVYQMEDRYGEHATRIGEVNYQVPDLGGGKSTRIQKGAYLDGNGIIHLFVHIPATGVTFENTVMNENDYESDAEAKKRLESLNYLNISNNEQDENNIIIEKAEKIYVELDMKARESLSSAISEFEAVVKAGKRSDIISARQKLGRIINTYQI